MKTQPQRTVNLLTCMILMLFLAFSPACKKDDGKESPLNPDPDNGGLKLPAGFGAIVVAGETGSARHLAVNKNGDIYVKLNELKGGAGILRLRDVNHDGKSDEELGFANFPGTGISIKDGYLYASSDNEIFRYRFNTNNEVENPDAPEKLVTGLTMGEQHASKSITLDDNQNIYVNIGAPSNSCQLQDRTPGSPGQDPCPLLDNSGGIWRFSATQTNQTQAQGTRYATGLRNVVGLDWNTRTDELFVMQHGRDQLSFLYPDLFTDSMSAELPAEEFLKVTEGADFGWPYCYYDHIQQKKVLSPEYGGDGNIVGRCESAPQPLVAFPGHWAPNALLFYTGNQFPDKYRDGAFIAFHGSWNRSPLRQGGYFVAFVPMKNGVPTGDWETFASGFPGVDVITEPDQAQYRPMGLAQGPDGSLYISDSEKGRIWRIVFKG